MPPPSLIRRSFEEDKITIEYFFFSLMAPAKELFEKSPFFKKPLKKRIGFPMIQIEGFEWSSEVIKSLGHKSMIFSKGTTERRLG